MRRSDSMNHDHTRRRWNCVCRFFGINPGDISPGATGLLHDENQYKLLKKRHRALVRLYHSDRGGKEVNSVKFSLIQSAWKFIESKYEPPIDITGDEEDERPVAIDRQIERSEEDDQYNISLAESEENDFDIWDLSQQKEKTKAAEVRPMESGHCGMNRGGTDVNMHNINVEEMYVANPRDSLVATRWCDNDSSMFDEEIQRKDTSDSSQEDSDKEVAEFKDGEQYWGGEIEHAQKNDIGDDDEGEEPERKDEEKRHSESSSDDTYSHFSDISDIDSCGQSENIEEDFSDNHGNMKHGGNRGEHESKAKCPEDLLGKECEPWGRALAWYEGTVEKIEVLDLKRPNEITLRVTYTDGDKEDLHPSELIRLPKVVGCKIQFPQPGYKFMKQFVPIGIISSFFTANGTISIIYCLYLPHLHQVNIPCLLFNFQCTDIVYYVVTFDNHDDVTVSEDEIQKYLLSQDTGGDSMYEIRDSDAGIHNSQKKTKKSPKKQKKTTQKSANRKRRSACGKCERCLKENCRSCRFCKDMLRYNGPNKLRQRCIERTCMNMLRNDK